MTAPEGHEVYAELAAGHALDALEPADDQVFRAHLETCAECQQEIARHTETLGHLAYAAEPADLPPGILEGIRRGIAGTAVTPADAEQPTRQPTERPAQQPVQLSDVRARRRAFSSRALVAAAAAVALVLGLGGWNVALHRDRSDANQRASQLAAAVSLLEQPAKHRVDLTDASGRAVAVAVVRPDDSVALVVDGLAPNNRDNSTYVLWQQVGKGMKGVAAFDVKGNGPEVLRDLRLPVAAIGGPGLAVTREPGRGVPAGPTSDPIAAGGLSA